MARLAVPTSIIFLFYFCYVFAASLVSSEECLSCASKPPRLFEFGDSKYAFVECPLLSWSDARQRCRKILGPGGDLVKIDSIEERQFISSSLSLLYGNDKFGFWIGLNHRNADQDAWHWLDDQNNRPNQFFWAAGQPNGNLVVRGRQIPDSPCVELIDNENWNDYECSFPLRFICEQSQASNPGGSGPIFAGPPVFDLKPKGDGPKEPKPPLQPPITN